jgi:hypothetical protein
MSLSFSGPLLFGELSGTNWHKRFAAEEFQIFLDHFPERVIIMDGCLSEEDLLKKVEIREYHEKITSYFLDNNTIDEQMPIEILNDLRRMRVSVFGGGKRGSASSSARFSGLNRQKYVASEPKLRNKLEAELKIADKVLFIPGLTFGIDDDIKLIKTLTDADVEVKYHTSFDLPLYADGIEELKGYQKNTFILTTNIWLYLEIFRQMKGFGFILNNSEWFSRGLFQTSFDSEQSRSLGLYKSGYSRMLRKADNDGLKVIAGVQTRLFPEDVDVTGVQHNSLSLKDFLLGKSTEELSKRILNRKNMVDCGLGKADLDSGFYRISPDEVSSSSVGAKNSVMVSTAVFVESDITASPIFLSSCAAPEALELSGSGFLSSFNYYFTENLLKLYNTGIPENQRVGMTNFFIDYLGIKQDGEWVETFPLYNKAFLGCMGSGRLFAGHYPLEEISLNTGTDQIVFCKEEINPEGDSSRHGFYLPSSGRESAGAGKYCIVLIQDQVIYQGQGPFLIPPMGAVAVISTTLSKVHNTLNIRTRLMGLPEEQSRLRWLIGGFNLLMGKGQNFYSTPADAEQSLSKEGWRSAASGRTQETQLIPGIRQPRVVFGRTEGGRLFLSQFSGRTRTTCGASFKDCIDFSRLYVAGNEKIDFLINFDGGASASLIGYKDGLCQNLSLSAPSMTNPAGTARPLPAYFSIKFNTATGEE